MPKIIKRLIIIFVLLTLVVFLSGLAFLCTRYVPPIAMYHSVNFGAEPGNRLVVSPQTFERQMQFLKNYRYNVITLEALANLIKDKKHIPPKTIVITFDDGYKDNYTYAFPILKRYNLPATIFLIVNEIGRTDRLSWDEIKEMQNSGLISFGSHCLGPEPLVDIKPEDARREIFDSKKILEKKLGEEITAFSYPEGRFTPQIRQWVIDAGYKVAVATSPGKKFPNDDVFILKRLRISESARNLFVFFIETSGIYTYIKEHRDED